MTEALPRDGARYQTEPKWVNFNVHARVSPEGEILTIDRADADMTGMLARLFTGQKLIVRYHLASGGSKDTIFQLGGDPDALLAALDLSWSE